MTIVFLLIPKMRKTGAVMAAALIIDLLLCNVILKNLVARTRPYDVNTGVQLLYPDFMIILFRQDIQQRHLLR